MKNLKNTLQAQKKGMDIPFLIYILILLIFGLIMVYDSSVIQALKDHRDSYYYIKRQLIWALLGLMSMAFFTKFNYQRLKKISLPLVVFSFLMLLAVFVPFLGLAAGGAHRWLKFGPIIIQPAEIIKLTGVIFLAAVFEKKTRIFPFLSLVVLVTLVTAVLQKDLGSTIVFVITTTLLYFAAGAPIWHFILTVPVGIITGLLLIVTSSYRTKRVLAFLDPFSDSQGFTYHITQVLIALGSGGLFGVGLGHSRQKFEYIPEVSTDSIFGVIGEELGFVGGALLVILFVIVMLRGFKIVTNCPDNFGKILGLGIVLLIVVQVVINLSAMTALLPVTGVPLPFISYGGSALVTNLTAVGILLNISKQTSKI